MNVNYTSSLLEQMQRLLTVLHWNVLANCFGHSPVMFKNHSYIKESTGSVILLGLNIYLPNFERTSYCGWVLSVNNPLKYLNNLFYSFMLYNMKLRIQYIYNTKFLSLLIFAFNKSVCSLNTSCLICSSVRVSPVIVPVKRVNRMKRQNTSMVVCVHCFTELP